MMKSDNLRKRGRLVEKAIKKAKERREKGFFEGSALAYLEAVKLLSGDEGSKQKADCLHNAGINFLRVEKYIQAEDCLQLALIILEEKLGKECLDVATTLDALGGLYLFERIFDKAEECFQRAFNIKVKILGSDHSDLATSLNNLGRLYEKKEDFGKAKEYYQLAKNLVKKSDNFLAEMIDENYQNLQQEIERLDLENREIQAALYQSKKLEYLGQMATLMAHNINQPIAVLRMAASGALSDVNDNLFDPETELKPLLEKLLAQTERLSDMMGNFRHFARGDRTVLSAVNLNDVIEAIYQLLFVDQYQLEQIDLQKEFSASPIAHANEWALQEMLISLLSNARAAVKDKTQKHVAIKTWQQDQQVGFCIEDSGDGIAEENLPKLFTPFLSSKEEGMGLGLYFCRQISHDLGGSIDYFPSPLGGAGFKITLPAQQE